MSVNVQCTRCGEWFVVPSDSTVATAPPHTCITPVPPERDYDDLLEFHSKTVTQYQQQCVEKDAEIARLREALEDIASSGCCETPACSIETPLCHPMIARAALEVNDE